MPRTQAPKIFLVARRNKHGVGTGIRSAVIERKQSHPRMSSVANVDEVRPGPPELGRGQMLSENSPARSPPTGGETATHLKAFASHVGRLPDGQVPLSNPCLIGENSDARPCRGDRVIRLRSPRPG